MDNNYEPDYGMDNGYEGKQSYGKDNSYDKSKDSSNVKCNNFNVNGLGINALPPALNGLATDGTQASAEEGEVGASSSGSDAGRPSGSDTDLRVVCIYNNISPEEECAEADEIEACFEENMSPEDFETLSAALQRGLKVAINDNPPVTLNSFADFCEVFEGLSYPDLENAVRQISKAANVNINLRDLSNCIAEVLDIPIPPPEP